VLQCVAVWPLCVNADPSFVYSVLQCGAVSAAVSVTVCVAGYRRDCCSF